jgi:hypothetical protein
MTKDEIITIAKEVGFSVEEIDKCKLMFERFAFLVAQHEREACAKVCDDNADDHSEGDWDSACLNCADHIRARGKA